MSNYKPDLELSFSKTPDYSKDTVDESLFKDTVKIKTASKVSIVEKELSSPKFDKRVEATLERPKYTSARPEDKERPLRQAIKEFKWLSIVKSPLIALKKLESYKFPKSFWTKYAKAITDIIGFYGNLYIDSNDFKCNEIKRALPPHKKSFKYIISSPRCSSCIYKQDTSCTLFGGELVSDKSNVKISNNEAISLIKNSTKNKEILKTAEDNPQLALQLFYILECD